MYRKGATIKISSLASKDDREPLLFPIPEGQIYIKGEGEDGIRINKDGKTYTFNMDSLRRKLERLYKKKDVHISKLESEKNDLEEIAQTMQNLYYDRATYAKLMKEIRNKFGDVKNPRPGTVAARFVGCFREDGEVSLKNKGCDPSCAGSLAPTDDVKNYAPCEDMVLHFENGTFISVRDGTNDHAYIGMNYTQCFTEENIKVLKNAGLTRVTLVVDGKDDNSRELRGPISVDELKTVSSESENSDSSSSSNAWRIAFIIILILLILAIIGLVYYSVFYMN